MKRQFKQRKNKQVLHKQPFYQQKMFFLLTSLCAICSFFFITSLYPHTQTTTAPPVPAENKTAPKPAINPIPTPTETEQSRFLTITDEQKTLRIPVLMYHDVQDIPFSKDNNIITKQGFETQLRYLKENGFTTIRVKEFIDAYHGKIKLPKKSVLLTFDDGFQSIKTIVAPLLKSYDMYATSFIIGSYIDRPTWHLTQSDIQEVQKQGNIDFESHTFDLHKDGKSKGLINETAIPIIVEDNKKLEAVIGHKSNILCYPFGAYSNNAFEGLKAANIPFGFAIQAGSSTWVSLNETHTTTTGEVQNPLALPRIRISPNVSIEAFAKLITEK